MIAPGIGRIVHYHPAYAHADPFAAIVCGLHYNKPAGLEDGAELNPRLVNLLVITERGASFEAIEVQLLQDDDEAPAEAPHAEWMPFQKGQAPASSAIEERVAKLETLLATGGDVHQLFEGLQTDIGQKLVAMQSAADEKFGALEASTDGKFRQLGDWLTPKLEAIETRLPAATPAPPDTPPAPDQAAAAQQPQS